jgi:hypothetical protein
MSCEACEAPFEVCVEQGGSFLYRATLKDENDAAVALAALSSLTLTVVDHKGQVINSRNGQDILNANNGTFHATSGLLTMRFVSADNPIVTELNREERHTATFRAAYGSGMTKNWEVLIKVRNIASV